MLNKKSESEENLNPSRRILFHKTNIYVNTNTNTNTNCG